MQAELDTSDGITIRVTDKTPELFQKLEAAIGRFVVKGAAYVEGKWKLAMVTPKTGHVYHRGDKIHIASAPGEAPAVDSSNYINSIEVLISENSLEAKIGTPVQYAAWLEDGTDRMAARPVVARTAAESLPTLDKLLKAEIGH